MEQYFEKGLTVIPLASGEKRPLVAEWTEKPREELYNEFTKYSDCNIGIRVDKPLFVVDIDNEKLLPLIMDEINARTWKVRTRRGYHIYLKADEYYPKTNKRGSMLQLLAEGCQVVAPPSKVGNHQYYFTSGPPDIEIASVNKRTVEKIEKIVAFLADGESFVSKYAEVWDEGHRHNLSLWLMGYFRKNNISKGEAAVWLKAICLLADDPELKDRLRALKDTYSKPFENIKGFNGLAEELEGIVGHQRAKELLEILPAKPSGGKDHGRRSEEKRGKIIKVFGGEIVDSKLLEVVENVDGEIRLLVWDGEKIDIVDQYVFDGVVYRPFEIKVYALPKIPDIGEDPTLWSDTVEFYREHFDHYDENVYHIMVATTAWSYFVHDVKVSTPYLCFLGEYNTGKSRGLKTMKALCYKGCLVEDVSGAALFRMTNIINPTLLIDELQAKFRDEEYRSLLADGYQNGSVVPRVIRPELEGLEALGFFNPFGLKIYATREEPPPDIVSRSIIIKCLKTARKVAPQIDEEKAAILRTRWLARRLKWWGKIKVRFDEADFEDGRLREIFSPLKVMAEIFGGEEAAQRIMEYGRRIEWERNSYEMNREEAEFVEAFDELLHEDGVDHDFIPTSKIVEKLGWETQKIGRIATRLGYMRIRSGKYRGYTVDYEIHERNKKRFRVGEEHKPPPKPAATPPHHEVDAGGETITSPPSENAASLNGAIEPQVRGAKKCEECGREAEELYRIPLKGLGPKLLCRPCANTAIA
ncbi:MAG: bifunctional DNA primase/polymerase [Nitrososphaerota archaeon]